MKLFEHTGDDLLALYSEGRVEEPDWVRSKSIY